MHVLLTIVALIAVAHCQLDAQKQGVLQAVINSVIAENGGTGPLVPEWQSPNLADACNPPLPGLVCFGTTSVDTWVISAMFQNPAAEWTPSSVPWVNMNSLFSLFIDSAGGMKGPLPTSLPPNIGTLQFGNMNVQNPLITGTVPSSWSSFFTAPRVLGLSNLPNVIGPLPAIESNRLQTLNITNLPRLDGPLPSFRWLNGFAPDLVLVNTAIDQLNEAICERADTTKAMFDNVIIKSNPRLRDPLPTCFFDCLFFDPFDPLIFLDECTIAFNQFCAVGLSLSESIPFVVDNIAVTGSPARTSGGGSTCNNPSVDLPCNIVRDRTYCIGCDGEENSPFSYDVCGLCLLDTDPARDTTCLDCAGEPNGDHQYDACDVCLRRGDPGFGLSCLDCLNQPFGTAVYDDCDVCNGDNFNKDCAGFCFGSSFYDRCGVCDGCDECVDCRDQPNGSTLVDRCGVCGGSNLCFPCDASDRDACGACFGDGSTCADCSGVPNGTSTYDRCDVCNGDNSCLDCAGVAAGTSVYDRCDVCNGDGTGCFDCAGTQFGTVTVDACGVCGGANACLDCAGVNLGFAVYDRCDVCNGDGTSCLDCEGVPNGSAVYDRCDICNGADTLPCPPVREQELAQAANSALSAIVLCVFLAVLSLFVLAVVIYYLCGLNRAGRRRTIINMSRDEFRGPPAAPRRTVSLSQPSSSPPPQSTVPPVFAYPKTETSGGGGGTATVRRVRPAAAAAGVGVGGVRAVRTLQIVAIACAALSGVSATPSNTAKFFAVMDATTNARSVYPSWYSGTTPTTQCDSSMDGLLCDPVRRTIFGLFLDRPLQGVINEPFLSYLDDAVYISIANAPDLRFTLAGVTDAFDLFALVVTNSGLYGALPDDIGELRKLRTLRISETKLEGGFPESMCNLNYLECLELRQNRLTCQLDPAIVGNWQSLRILDVRANRCSGGVPADWGEATNLECLLLDNNAFAGPFPVSVPQQQFKLKKLGLSSNRFEGDEWGPFFNLADTLEELWLDNNCFGPRLPSVSDFEQLEHVGISHNKFSQTEAGTSIFFLGVNFGPLKTLLANNNSFTGLVNTYSDAELCGVCDFRDNPLCTDGVGGTVPQQYIAPLGCTFELLDNVCGTCGDLSCVDCRGVKDGSSVYDACDVCNGDGTLCNDCAGVPNGSSAYDACDVCDGDGSTCLDCAGAPGGPAEYDRCDVCGGDDSTCRDCAGAINGPSEYDRCDVCDGDGTACLDCAGVLGGSSRKDECGVCNGDGSACADPLQMDAAAELVSTSFGSLIFLLVGSTLLMFCSGVLLCWALSRFRNRRPANPRNRQR